MSLHGDQTTAPYSSGWVSAPHTTAPYSGAWVSAPHVAAALPTYPTGYSVALSGIIPEYSTSALDIPPQSITPTSSFTEFSSMDGTYNLAALGDSPKSTNTTWKLSLVAIIIMSCILAFAIAIIVAVRVLSIIRRRSSDIESSSETEGRPPPQLHQVSTSRM
ncbi:hypothetical protein FRB99_008711 [Tulasnella sp. 403]|nr:hypothetical protein FRB99_008711 [Tulasnella sp. 403]